MTRRTAGVIATMALVAAAGAAACFPDYVVGSGGDAGGESGSGSGSDSSSGTDSGSGSSSGGSGSGSGGVDAGGDAGDATVDSGGDAAPVEAGGDVQSDVTYMLDAGDGAILSGMVAVDGGPFTFPVYVGAGDITAWANLDYQVAIDVNEVTVGAFTQFVNAGMPLPCGDGGACSLDQGGPYAGEMTWDPQWNAMAQSNAYTGGSSCSSDLGGSPIVTYGANPNYPVTCVPWQQALAYCAWLGKRLPTDTEWRFFATGAGTRNVYPWGTTPDPDCNYATGDFDGGRCGFPVVVRHASLGASKDGVYDLVGSLSEWLWDRCSVTGNYAYPTDAGTDYPGPKADSGAGMYPNRLWIPSDWDDQANSYFGSDRSGAGSADTSVGYDNCGFRCAVTKRYP
ncbi:MAG TPA: SUMF1/EgtB/PvdO family nonheme iron enzyme [Polyangiaceae bacterium]